MMLSLSFSFGFAAQRVSECSEPAIYTNIGKAVFMGGSCSIWISEPEGTDPLLRPLRDETGLLFQTARLVLPARRDVELSGMISTRARGTQGRLNS
jgi:hypothetical protein